MNNNLLYYIIINKWKENHEIIKWIFINENNNNDKKEIKLNQYLKIEKDDIIFENSWKKREIIWKKMILNINNILILFMNLSMINIKIVILIIINSMKNLKKNIHINYNKTLLYLISYFHFNYFKYNIKFDLFIFLLILYNKNLK